MKLSNRQRNRSSKIELSMTSMIDVVFLLLIFFLVTTTFVAPERQLKTNVKTQQESASSKPVDLEPAIVDIFMQDGKPIFQMGANRTSDVRELLKTLEGFNNQQDGAFVRAADDVPFEMPVQAINACKNAGFTSVTYVPLQTGNGDTP